MIDRIPKKLHRPAMGPPMRPGLSSSVEVKKIPASWYAEQMQRVLEELPRIGSMTFDEIHAFVGYGANKTTLQGYLLEAVRDGRLKKEVVRDNVRMTRRNVYRVVGTGDV